VVNFVGYLRSLALCFKICAYGLFCREANATLCDSGEKKSDVMVQ
jgi:hypothetical protein